ncbi:hypothetical protein Glove_311g64 [Diversispora epigaea]|uniref:Uncharacterized protein n=1 Tax=Diversispora epigaea TaxID=1348612 RepID=A0A397HRH3_9GLOM|nr:hypothetical protein Glove_311g64 [Diversispora epigaea]
MNFYNFEIQSNILPGILGLTPLHILNIKVLDQKKLFPEVSQVSIENIKDQTLPDLENLEITGIDNSSIPKIIRVFQIFHN